LLGFGQSQGLVAFKKEQIVAALHLGDLAAIGFEVWAAWR
jgi:hypothetical protein